MAVKATSGTRGTILELLKRSGGMTPGEIASSLGVSTMAAHQHLTVLEGEGLVQSEPRRKGVGRPSHFYRLTEKGQETFPRLYDTFLILILQAVREVHGEEGLEELLRWRTEFTDREYGPRLRSLPPRERAHALSRLQEGSGHMVEIEDLPDRVVITEHNCPIARVSRQFPEICRHEVAMLNRLVALPVTRVACMAEGAHVCCYHIGLSPQEEVST